MVADRAAKLQWLNIFGPTLSVAASPFGNTGFPFCGNRKRDLVEPMRKEKES
jgi:hypothetical protein